MTPSPDSRIRPAPLPDEDVADLVGHPRGTLAIVFVFAALFTLGWFGLFLFRFLEQGAPHH